MPALSLKCRVLPSLPDTAGTEGNTETATGNTHRTTLLAPEPDARGTPAERSHLVKATIRIRFQADYRGPAAWEHLPGSSY